jgi:hypothetical protein
MFVYSSHGKWVFPPLCGVFLPPPFSQVFPLLVAGHAPPLPPEPLWPAWLVYLHSLEGFPFPHSLVLNAPHPLSRVSLLFLLLFTQFLFFPQVEVSLFRGLCCSGPGLSVGVSRYHKAHLVCIFPSHLVWRGQSFASFRWFCLQGVSPESLQDFTIGGMLSASSL